MKTPYFVAPLDVAEDMLRFAWPRLPRTKGPIEMLAAPGYAEDDDSDSALYAAFKHMCRTFNEDRRQKNESVSTLLGVPWTKHTEHHWSLILEGNRLDFWPSKNKWMYLNNISKGIVYYFIINIAKKENQNAK